MYTWRKFKTLFAALILSILSMGTVNAIPISADVISIIDESGSMSGEHAWIGGMITNLDSELLTAGVGTGTQTNRYGMTGFGNILHDSSGGLTQEPHKHVVGGGDFGTAADFAAATPSLDLTGSLEDGWAGINFAMNNYTLNSNAAINMILVSDEDRDNSDPSLTYDSVLNDLLSNNALLNAVVNATFRCGDGSSALGIDSNGTGYKADGAGGFTTCDNAIATIGFGTTITDYVNLALATGGAAWDLNQLRSGGLTATSFTAAFVDIKVQEIVNTPVPEPHSLTLLCLSLAGIGFVKRRNSK
ncbi:MAG: PEP-CTERM sorting domain-containing protein [Gammaproteobacteria bacterium]|nr:PEP-CTERM sorting domain-containing protein [Gammaproteobacteria bacterium]MDH5654228.1 PEP-CTERM sorting domain-containing protein [Gammaproteobacteria bacterium]